MCVKLAYFSCNIAYLEKNIRNVSVITVKYNIK